MAQGEVSGTYNFQALENDELILECFERLGFSGDQLIPVQLNSAKRSLNLLMLDWITKNTNLWTLKLGYISLQTGQSQYELEPTITDVLQVNLREFNRELNGTPRSNTGETYDGFGGGTPVNAFDNNDGTTCTQLVENGNISYTYEFPKTINFIGIQSNVDANYDLSFEYSNDNIIWTPLNMVENDQFDNFEYSFTNGIARWFDVALPVSATSYRVRETGDTGNKTLDLQEIYFCNQIRDLKLSPQSRDTYLSFSQKTLEGRPTSYYFNKQIDPILHMWYPPLSIYKVLQYSYVNIMQDAGGFYNIAAVPSRMYPALIAGLTSMLAVKYNPEMADAMKSEYEEAYAVATANDVEDVPIKIEIDYSNYYDK